MIATRVTAAILYAMAVRVALNPVGAAERFARQTGSYPSSAPGAATWEGDDRN